MSRLRKVGQWLAKPFVRTYRRIKFRFFFKWKPQLVRIVPSRRDLRDRPGRPPRQLLVQPLVPHIEHLPIHCNIADLIKIAMKDGMEMDVRPGEGSDFILQAGDFEGTFDSVGTIKRVELKTYAFPGPEGEPPIYMRAPQETFDALGTFYTKHFQQEKKT